MGAKGLAIQLILIKNRAAAREITMGYALKRPDQIAVGRRPSKALRPRNIQLVNLGTYTQSAPPRVPNTHPKQTKKASAQLISAQGVASQKIGSEYFKLESQPFDGKAATNDTAFSQSDSGSRLHTAPKNQLTLIILSSLCVGSLVGYQWSSMLNPAASFSDNAEPKLLADSTTSEETDPTELAIISVASTPTSSVETAPIASPAQTDLSETREKQFLMEQEEFLSQIDWLKNQNSVLVIEKDALSEETTEQNRELLALELEVLALQSQSEPTTETRVVYNFVNVPLGAAPDLQYDDTRYQYNEDASEDNDSLLADQFEQQRNQYNSEGQLVYDLETGSYVSNDSEVGNGEYNGPGSPNIDSTEYPIDAEESYETVNSELINELQKVRLRQFEAGLLDYDHETGTFVQKNFANVNSGNIPYPPIPVE